MSGTEKDRGQIGVGKSCLANRFVRPLNDDYYIDHISVLSQSDFSGRVVNNDHFLYWGDCRKTADDGTEFLFQVVEQTEFIDDATFQPFKGGKMEPYLKRCTAVRLQSAEKLMYVCKNQLGIEREYEQKVLHEGRIFIDGFVCVFDVSPVPNRNIERQADFCINILNNLLKTKKPIVFVTTKNDEASEVYVREAEKLMQRKEFRNVIPMVECSAHDAINVDMAFMVLAQLVDKSKQRQKVMSYNDAARLRKDLLETSTENVTRLVQKAITDYHVTWGQANKILAMYAEWQDFVQLFGQEHAQKIFRRHVKWLREENLQRKLGLYMENLACTLQDLMPDLQAMNCEATGGHGPDDWEVVQGQLKNHVDYEQYFMEPADVPWPELSDASDNEDEQRVPFDVLDTPEAETVFKNHVNALQQEQKRLEMPKRWKKQFKKLLEETGYVTPGKQLAEVRVLFMGRECFEALSEHDCQLIYDNHQRDIIEKAKINFQELLLEHADLFHHFKSIEPSGSITQEDVKEITEVLKDDLRYKLLDRLDQDRKLMLFQHLGFVHCPIREHCPAYPNCMDALVERIIEAKKSHSLKASSRRAGGGGGGAISRQRGAGGGRRTRPAKTRHWRQSMHKSTDYTLNLLMMGAEPLASDLVNEVCLNCGEGEYIYDGQTYFLAHRIVDGEMETFKRIDFQTSGLVGVYSNIGSFEYLKESLEKSLLCNLELEDRESLPLVLVYQPEDTSQDEAEIELLRREGQQLADVLHCLFVDTSLTYYHHRTSQHQNYIYDIINHLIECVRMADMKREADEDEEDPQEHDDELDDEDEEEEDDDDLDEDDLEDRDEDDEFAMNAPDIRIILCMFCGDPFSVEALLGPMMAEANCSFTSDRSITVETFIGDQKRRIEIILSSYHGANAFRDELVHGFILLYSTKRRASLSTLNAFSMNIPNLPMQMLAITESASASAFFSNEMCQLLITDGNSVADRLRAHFMTSPTGSQLKLAFYTPFLKEVWDKKPEIEQAFHMEEPVTLDSGEGTLEHSMHHHLPQPPPRHESYLMKQQHSNSIMNNINNNSHDGSGSENYEHLPTRSLNSLNGPDDNIKLNLNDNNDKYHMYHRSMIGEKHMSMDNSYGPGDMDGEGDKARLLHQGFQIYPPPTTPPEPAPPDHHHLMAPMLRHHLKGGPAMASASQSSLDEITCRLEDSLLGGSSGSKRNADTLGLGTGKRSGIMWNNFSGHHAFTTGRGGGGGVGGGSGRSNNDSVPFMSSSSSGKSSGRPKGPSHTLKQPQQQQPYQQPGKLNLKNFAIVNDAIARMNVSDGVSGGGMSQSTSADTGRGKGGLGAMFMTMTGGGSGSNSNSSTTGRGGGGSGKPPPPLPPQQQQQHPHSTASSNHSTFAPHSNAAYPGLAAGAEGHSDDDGEAEYAQVQEIYPGADGGMGGMLGGEQQMYTFSQDTTPNKGPGNKMRPQRSRGGGGPMDKGPQTLGGKYSETDSDSSSQERKSRGYDGYYKMNRKAQTHKRPRKKRAAIPVQPPKVPSFGMGSYVQPPEVPMMYQPRMKQSSVGVVAAATLGAAEKKVGGLIGSTWKGGASNEMLLQEDESSVCDVSSPRDNNSPIFGILAAKAAKEQAELLQQQARPRTKEEEKLERRRAKDDATRLRKMLEKEKELEKKAAKRKGKKGEVQTVAASLPDFIQSETNYIPLFLEKCILFIEQEGLDSEGIYRVPGNRAHVDLLYQKFEEESNIDIEALDIPVNAVATALKDFFSKHLPPLFDDKLTTELEDIAGSRGLGSNTLSMEVKTDRSCRLLALRGLLNKMPPINFTILKYIFHHFVRVSENAKLNSMDSKNLAICWWPTLIPIEFTDMGHFEQLRPYLEDIVQTMIDQFPFLFCGKEAFVMV